MNTTITTGVVPIVSLHVSIIPKENTNLVERVNLLLSVLRNAIKNMDRNIIMIKSELKIHTPFLEMNNP